MVALVLVVMQGRTRTKKSEVLGVAAIGMVGDMQQLS